MTKKAPCIDQRRRSSRSLRPRAQRGDALLEGLVGALLLAIIGLGLTYAAARAVNTQRHASGHHIVLTQMLNALETHGVQHLCSGSGTATATLPIVDRKTGEPIFSDIALPAPECSRDTVTITPPAGSTLPATTVDSVVTRMTLSTPDDERSSARALLGPGSLALSQ